MPIFGTGFILVDRDSNSYRSIDRGAAASEGSASYSFREVIEDICMCAIKVVRHDVHVVMVT